MHIVQSPDKFVATIADERRIVQEFLEVLTKEEGALIQGRIDDLDILASDKARLAEKLDCQAKRRMQYLSFLGYSPDKSGMQLWLSKQKNAELHTVWNELTELARTAEQINKTNGKIISTLLQYNQRTYMALQSAAGNISLYGPKGQAFI